MLCSIYIRLVEFGGLPCHPQQNSMFVCLGNAFFLLPQSGSLDICFVQRCPGTTAALALFAQAEEKLRHAADFSRTDVAPRVTLGDTLSGHGERAHGGETNCFASNGARLLFRWQVKVVRDDWYQSQSDERVGIGMTHTKQRLSLRDGARIFVSYFVSLNYSHGPDVVVIQKQGQRFSSIRQVRPNLTSSSATTPCVRKAVSKLLVSRSRFQQVAIAAEGTT